MFKNIDQLKNDYLTVHGRNALWVLWLDKYSYQWIKEFDKEREKESDKNKEMQKKFPPGKTSALIITSELARSPKLAESYKNKLAFIDRLKNRYCDRLRIVELVNESRLMLHLGKASVLENVGLYAERVTGLLIIPGTAIKGALSTWAFWEANKIKDTLYGKDNFIKKRKKLNNLAKKIFGDDSDGGSEHSGEIVFVGGFPAAPPELGLDIVNLHFDENGKEKDTLKPNTFLCIEPGTVWKFIFFAKAGAENYQELLQQTEEWLKACLKSTGIGAKTAAGYGRFREVQKDDIQRVEDWWRKLEPVASQSLQSGKRPPVGTAGQTQPPKPQQTRQEPPQYISKDYENEETFKNLVVKNLEISKLDNLKKEIEKLKKDENKEWREKFLSELAKKTYKDVCKALQSKDWFPKEWLSCK